MRSPYPAAVADLGRQQSRVVVAWTKGHARMGVPKQIARRLLAPTFWHFPSFDQTAGLVLPIHLKGIDFS